MVVAQMLLVEMAQTLLAVMVAQVNLILLLESAQTQLMLAAAAVQLTMAAQEERAAQVVVETETMALEPPATEPQIQAAVVVEQVPLSQHQQSIAALAALA